MGLFTKLFGTRSEREIKQIQPIVDKILALEEEYKALSEDEIDDLDDDKKNDNEDDKSGNSGNNGGKSGRNWWGRVLDWVDNSFVSDKYI